MFPFHQYSMGISSDRALFNPIIGAFIERSITRPNELDARVSSLEGELRKIHWSQEELHRSQANLVEASKYASVRVDSGFANLNDRLDRMFQLLEASKPITSCNSGVASLDDRFDRLFQRLEASSKSSTQSSSLEATFAGEVALQVYEDGQKMEVGSRVGSKLEGIPNSEFSLVEDVKADEVIGDSRVGEFTDGLMEGLISVSDRDSVRKEATIEATTELGSSGISLNKEVRKREIVESFKRMALMAAREEQEGGASWILGLSGQHKFEAVLLVQMSDEDFGSKTEPDPGLLGPPPWPINFPECSINISKGKQHEYGLKCVWTGPLYQLNQQIQKLKMGLGLLSNISIMGLQLMHLLDGCLVFISWKQHIISLLSRKSTAR